MRWLSFTVIYVMLVTNAAAEGQSDRCPDRSDLADGIIVTQPARQGLLFVRHRQLDGTFVGGNYINGIFPDKITISYADLFTHKAWRNGELVQHEVIKADEDKLLRFEADTEVLFTIVRRNEAADREFRIDGRFIINPSPDVDIGGCRYKAVEIRRDAKLTMPDQTVKPDRDVFVYIPELLLRVSGSFGDVNFVRRRATSDGTNWPFDANPKAALLRPH